MNKAFIKHELVYEVVVEGQFLEGPFHGNLLGNELVASLRFSHTPLPHPNLTNSPHITRVIISRYILVRTDDLVPGDTQASVQVEGSLDGVDREAGGVEADGLEEGSEDVGEVVNVKVGIEKEGAHYCFEQVAKDLGSCHTDRRM